MGRQVKLSVGQKIGRWLLLGISVPGTKTAKAKWLCQCDCGTRRDVDSGALKSGVTNSCGCLRSELIKARGTGWAEHKKSAWKRWERMISRCYNPQDKSYKNYGARGITVCSEWRESFESFFKDMGEPPRGRFSLDRINNDGPYCKENCRWATDSQQSRNRRDNHWYPLGERLVLLADAAHEFGMCLRTLKSRIKREGMTMEQALSLPLRKPGPKKKSGGPQE